ncbi:MAG TPA: ferritin-like domain-containing protein [Urbifossiella sp.]|jgi:hypothetical protein
MRESVRTSAEWIAYFHANAADLLDVPWDVGAGLTDAERDLVAASLPTWQLGESSDGRHLRRAAERYAAQVGDPNFIEAIDLFIKEEQRHGAELGRFLDLAGIPRKKWDWGDAVFRLFRHFMPRIEITATVVVAVEIHALLYYAAIRRATGSLLLRRICQQILRDEPTHLHFQCERLARIHRRRPRWLLAVTMLAHRLLFTGTTLTIWATHRRALRAGGLSFGRFWRTAWAKMSWARKLMDPKRYSWPSGGSPVIFSEYAVESSPGEQPCSASSSPCCS